MEDADSTVPASPRPTALFVGVSDDFFGRCSAELGALGALRSPDVQAAIDLMASHRPLVVIFVLGSIEREKRSMFDEVAHDIAAEIVAVDERAEPIELRDIVLSAAYRAEQSRKARTKAKSKSGRG